MDICFFSHITYLYSYKRLVANHWAPIAVGWGYENRTTALRVITTPSCSHQSTRVEIVSHMIDT
jgi:glutamine synthetase